MVYHSWSRRICLSTSADGIAWEAPISLNLGEEEAMYPNLTVKREIKPGDRLSACIMLQT